MNHNSISWVLFCCVFSVAFLQLAVAEVLKLKHKMEEHQIVPDVIDVAPKLILKVKLKFV